MGRDSGSAEMASLGWRACSPRICFWRQFAAIGRSAAWRATRRESSPGLARSGSCLTAGWPPSGGRWVQPQRSWASRCCRGAMSHCGAWCWRHRPGCEAAARSAVVHPVLVTRGHRHGCESRWTMSTARSPMWSGSRWSGRLCPRHGAGDGRVPHGIAASAPSRSRSRPNGAGRCGATSGESVLRERSSGAVTVPCR